MPDTALFNLTSVSKRYDGAQAARAPVLSSVSLSLFERDFVAVVGKSGSGKTTLLNLLAGLDRPSEGRVTFGATDLATLGESALARWRGREVGVVFQFYQLLPTLTVAENVLLPMDFLGLVPRAKRAPRADALLELTGVGDQADKLPGELSGGQQQRAAIARALANEPKVLLADEPTGNLDSATAESIWNLFQSLHSQGTTIITVTHDEEQARRATRTIRIADGEITHDGNRRFSE